MKKSVMVLSVLLLFGCSGKQVDNGFDDLMTIPVPVVDYTPFDLSELSKDAFYVELATADSCLVGDVDKLFYINHQIVVGSDHNSILFFNEDGTFSHKLSRQGNGPEEYLRISDFDIHRDSRVISVLDTRKRQILEYGWEGDFLRKADLDFWAIGIQPLNDSLCVLYSGNQLSGENHCKFAAYDFSSSSVRNRFYSIDERKSSYLHIHSANNFSRCGEDVLFGEMYNDTIYSVTSSGCIPSYYMDFGDNKVPPSFYGKKYANIMEFQDEFHKYDFSYGISSLVNLPSGILFSCFMHKKRSFVYCDKSSQEAVSFVKLSDTDFWGDDLSIDVNAYHVQFYSDNDYLLMLADNELYMREKMEGPKWSLGKVEAENNPIVRVCKVR